MDKSQNTHKNSAKSRLERIEQERAERVAQVNALRKVRDDPKATAGERLEAVKLLLKLEQENYVY